MSASKKDPHTAEGEEEDVSYYDEEEGEDSEYDEGEESE
jgi:hypothetical protein